MQYEHVDHLFSQCFFHLVTMLSLTTRLDNKAQTQNHYIVDLIGKANILTKVIQKDEEIQLKSTGTQLECDYSEG